MLAFVPRASGGGSHSNVATSGSLRRKLRHAPPAELSASRPELSRVPVLGLLAAGGAGCAMVGVVAKKKAVASVGHHRVTVLPMRSTLTEEEANDVDEAEEEADGPNDYYLELGSGDLTDDQAREAAWHYIAKRTKLTDEFVALEAEFERLAVVSGDPGAAMDLNDKRLELEEEVEAMKANEQELSELMVQIRGIKEIIKSREKSLGALTKEMDAANAENEAAQAELTRINATIVECDSAIAKCKESKSQTKIEIRFAEGKAEQAKKDQAAAMQGISELEAVMAEKKALADSRQQELDVAQAKLKELEAEGGSWDEKTAQAAELLRKVCEKTGELKAAIAESQKRSATLKGELDSARSAAESLPAELREVVDGNSVLETALGECRAQLEPQEVELKELRAQREVLQGDVAKLTFTQAEVAAQNQAEQAQLDELSKEKAALEEEVKQLKQSKLDAEADLRSVMRTLPSLEQERTDLESEVKTSTEEARKVRALIRTEAREVQRTMKEGRFGEELVHEREQLQVTSQELMHAARVVTDAQRKAEESFQHACAERQRASAGLMEFQEVMQKHLAHMQAEESLLSKSLEEETTMQQKLQGLLGSAESRLTQLEETKEAQVKFIESIEEKGEIDDVDKAVEKAVKVFGMVGNMFSSISSESRQLADAGSNGRSNGKSR